MKKLFTFLIALVSAGSGCGASSTEQIEAFEKKLNVVTKALEDSNATFTGTITNHPFSAGLSEALVIDSGVSASVSFIANPGDLSAKALLEALISRGIIGPGPGSVPAPAKAPAPVAAP